MTIQFCYNTPNKKSGLYHAVMEIAHAINAYTPHKVILEQSSSKNGVDIYHCHNSISPWIAGEVERRMIFQAHSYPQLMRDRVEQANAINQRVGGDRVLVVAQRQLLEPEYKGWVPVRLPVTLPDAFVPSPTDGIVRIVASPSSTKRQQGTWDKRTDIIENALAEQTAHFEKQIRTRIITGRMREVVLASKTACHIFLGEITTGSYGLSALEAAAIGRVSIQHVHPHVAKVATNLARASNLPFIDSSPTTISTALTELIHLGHERLGEMGRANFNWMQTHWHPRDIANEYVKQYERVLGYL